ncbi:hypothetical protein F4V58_12325 [Corynebacterium phocae]|nr:hypothetical protein F4V58_12325 [Corynebacterium phocae]
MVGVRVDEFSGVCPGTVYLWPPGGQGGTVHADLHLLTGGGSGSGSWGVQGGRNGGLGGTGNRQSQLYFVKLK